MLDAVRIQPRADALRDDVQAIILKVLRHPGDEGGADHEREQLRHAHEEPMMVRGELLRFGGVVADDVAENRRIEQRERLVDRREHQREKNEVAVGSQVAEQEAHSGE